MHPGGVGPSGPLPGGPGGPDGGLGPRRHIDTNKVYLAHSHQKCIPQTFSWLQSSVIF